ncbi:hypothetical protein ACO0LM_01560 [Undibacterium sp. Di26W]|uniref:hypothetical protein n=1 Tax=Undibacterium sp. Di26W TaxID=3413035 RepID=UPI003BF3FFF1
MTNELNYGNVQIIVQGASAGQKIVVTVTPTVTGDSISWCTSDPAKLYDFGITLNATAGVPVPIQSFNVTGQTIQLTTSNAGTGSSSLVNLTIGACLSSDLATGRGVFNVISSGDSGPVVTLQFTNNPTIYTLNNTPLPVIFINND